MQKLSLPNAFGLALLLCGILALTTSVIFVSSISAFIGLGLTFWGALLLFLKRERYVKSKLLDSTVVASLESLSKIITELDYKGKAIYLPPKYLKDFKSGIVYISKREGDERIPPTEAIREEKLLSKNPQGMCITPPGLDLTNLYENEIGTDFVRTDPKYLRNKLPKLFTETLEIAQNLEMNTEGSLIQVNLIGSVYKGFCNKARKLPRICNSVGCPLCSSIACALSRTTGKPIIIEKNECSEDGKTINVQYRVLEE